ncbi:NAD(P)-binding protein [Auriculariales sp. MPI-PUGE-AT-0066]|nr:NAD(P)-binding protein [Auriculariales sp. MPI-PUGE-AT-0066]
MPSISVARASNATFAPKSRPVVVVFGGTSGIGAGTARAFATHLNGAIHLVVVGRSRGGYDALVSSLPHHPDSLYEFVPADLMLLRNVRALTTELRTNSRNTLRAPLAKINYFLISSGAWFIGHPGTEDGLSPVMALGLYVAAALGEDARVMTVGYAGAGGEVYLDDLGLRKDYGMSKWKAAYMTYQDVFCLEVARLHPTISITHVFPGLVDSKLGDTLPWYLKYPYYALLALMSTTPEKCGEWMMYAMVDPTAKTGAHFKSDKADAVPASKYATPAARAKVWGHLVLTNEKVLTEGRA